MRTATQSFHNRPDFLPLPFPYVRVHGERMDRLADAPFLVATMLTGGYSEYADRLACSCEAHGLQYIIYEVPEVHRSISPKGGADPSFTKANLIRFLLDAYRKPILYVDVDCVLTGAPDKIEELVRGGYDIAIYNWLAGEHTECYVPVKINLTIGGKTQKLTNRYYRFGLSMDYYSASQLNCSGAV